MSSSRTTSPGSSTSRFSIPEDHISFAGKALSFSQMRALEADLRSSHREISFSMPQPSLVPKDFPRLIFPVAPPPSSSFMDHLKVDVTLVRDADFPRYIPERSSYEEFYHKGKILHILPHNPSLQGFDRECRTEIKTICGMEFIVHRYPSGLFTGHDCRLQIAHAPEGYEDLVGTTTKIYEESKQYKSEREALKELARKVEEVKQKVEQEKDQQSTEVPLPLQIMPAPEPKPETSQENTSGGEAAGEIVSEKLDPAQPPKLDPENPHIISRQIRQFSGGLKKEGKEAQKQSEAKFKDATAKLKKAEILKAKIDASKDDTITIQKKGQTKVITKAEAQKMYEQKYQQGMQGLSDSTKTAMWGTGKATIGRAGKHVAKAMDQQVAQVPQTALACGLGTITNVALDAVIDGKYDGFKEAAGTVVESTAKGTAQRVVEEIALEGVKGALKEVAPQVAKNLPGVSTLHLGYNVASSLCTASSVSEAAGRVTHIARDAGISTGCGIAGFALAGPPGAMVGSCVVAPILTRVSQLAEDWVFGYFQGSSAEPAVAMA